MRSSRTGMKALAPMTLTSSENRSSSVIRASVSRARRSGAVDPPPAIYRRPLGRRPGRRRPAFGPAQQVRKTPAVEVDDEPPHRGRKIDGHRLPPTGAVDDRFVEA